MDTFIVILACLACNGLLAAAEIAFVAVSRPGLRELARQGHKKAELLLRLRESPERTLSVIQVGITLVGALAGAVGGAGAEEWLSPTIQRRTGFGEDMSDAISIGIIVVPLTYMTVVAGELVPKTLALQNPSGVALRAAPWLSWVDRMFRPIVSVLEFSTKLILRLVRSRKVGEAKRGDGASATVELAHLSELHRQYVLNLLGLQAKQVKDIVIPWPNVVAVDIDQGIEEVRARVVSSGHTRLPVLRGGKVVGVLNTKEFVALGTLGEESWTRLLRPAVELQETTSLLAALQLFQERRSHLGIVYSSSTLVGIVTLEDILEEVVGEIYDEDDDGGFRMMATLSAGRLPIRGGENSGSEPG